MRDTQRVIKKSNNPQNRDVNAAARAVMALQLRAQGMKLDDIAQRTGYANAASCRNAILREMNRTVTRNVDELRHVELLRLEELHEMCWKLAFDEKNKGRLFAVDRLLSIAERRAKLMGLDTKSDEAEANGAVIREMPKGYLGEVQG